jgi:hypothetical protein
MVWMGVFLLICVGHPFLAFFLALATVMYED